MDSPAPLPPLRSSSSSNDLGLPRNYKMALLVGGGLVFVAILALAFWGAGKKPASAAGNTPHTPPGGTLVNGQTQTDGGLPNLGAGGVGGTGNAGGAAGTPGGAGGAALGMGQDRPAAENGGGTPNPIAGGPIAINGGTGATGGHDLLGDPTHGGTVVPGVTGGTTATHTGAPGSPGTVATGHTSQYKVQRDDTLWLIARKTLGDGRAWPAIAKANPGVNPNRMSPGTVLKIPEVAGTHTALTTHGTTGATGVSGGAAHTGTTVAHNGATGSGGSHATTNGKQVTVHEGETLYAIARREYGDGEKWDLIFNANKAKIANPDEVPAGVRLVIPAG